MERSKFSQFITDIYSRGALILAMGIGHDLGLFRVLCEADKPLSLQEVADELNFKERYTKEWLSAMVAAGIILQDKDTDMYIMPEGHKEELKLRSSYAPQFNAWANRAELTKACFRKDGPYGFGFDEEPTWFEWFKDYRASMVDHMLDAELFPRLEDQGIIPKLESGIKVLDIGCGVGSFTIALAKKFPASTFTGLDYAAKAVELAHENVKKTTVKNVRLVQGDAHNLPDTWTGEFDWVFVYDTLHDLPNPHKALCEIYRVLKDDGCLSLVDIGVHSNPVENAGDFTAAMYYSLSMFVCLPSSLTEEACVGYGACWGRENIEKAVIGAKFKIKGNSSIIMKGPKIFLPCIK